MSFFSTEQTELASKLLNLCRHQNIMITTAESCTGGLIAACLTAIAGSSDVFDRGFVTYTNKAKVEMLGVPKEMINTVGAVSEEVAVAMSKGALVNSNAGLTVAVTGIAGPGGGTTDKPVGLVHLAVANKNEERHRWMIYNGNRDEVRDQTVTTALEMMISMTKG